MRDIEEEALGWITNYSAANSKERRGLVVSFVDWLLAVREQITLAMVAMQSVRKHLGRTESANAGELLNRAVKELDRRRKKDPVPPVLAPPFYIRLPEMVDEVNQSLEAIYGGKISPISLSWLEIATREGIEEEQDSRIGAIMEGSPIKSLLAESLGVRMETAMLSGSSLPFTTDGITQAFPEQVKISIRDGYAKGLIKHSGVRRLQNEMDFACFLAHEAIHGNAPEVTSTDEELAVLNSRGLIDQVVSQKPDADRQKIETSIRSLLQERGFKVTIFGTSTRVILTDGTLLAGVGGNESNELITELLAKPVQMKLVAKLIDDLALSGNEIQATLDAAERSNFSTSLTMRDGDFSQKEVWNLVREFGIDDLSELLDVYRKGGLPSRFLDSNKTYFMP